MTFPTGSIVIATDNSHAPPPGSIGRVLNPGWMSQGTDYTVLEWIYINPNELCIDCGVNRLDEVLDNTLELYTGPVPENNILETISHCHEHDRYTYEASDDDLTEYIPTSNNPTETISEVIRRLHTRQQFYQEHKAELGEW
jgi:hypothetical protein